MIDINVKVHDKYSIEFKAGLHVQDQLTRDTFAVNTWIFIPNSLDINPMTYTKPQFYDDVKSNVRFITPRFMLCEITEGNALPLNNLRKAVEDMVADPVAGNIREYEYQIKMFSAIVKSAQRNEVTEIVAKYGHDNFDSALDAYVANMRQIVCRYRRLRELLENSNVKESVRNYFLFGDEFLSNILEQNTYRLIERLEKRGLSTHGEHYAKLTALIREENRYKCDRGYLTVKKGDPKNNREVVFRHGVLKKYIESDLYLFARKKKDGIIVEQFLYSIAAGIAMIFATVVAFWGQKRYGAVTTPLFFALVISYMLKDRIKDVLRYYFAHRLSAKYFDNKTAIEIKGAEIGWIKEAVDFVTDTKTPKEVMEIRSRSPLLEAENRTTDEKILLYRKLVNLDREALKLNNKYPVSGINDITRLHFNHFILKTDNPLVPLHTLNQDGSISVVESEKPYYINIIMQMQFEGLVEYKRFRVVFNRLGISGIEELK